jgi:hypothetical protein
MKDRWAKFLADKEWIEIKRVTGSRGPLVGDIAGPDVGAHGLLGAAEIGTEEDRPR